MLLAGGVAVVVGPGTAHALTDGLMPLGRINLKPRLPRVHDVTPYFPVPIGFASTANANPTPVSFAFATVKALQSSG